MKDNVQSQNGSDCGSGCNVLLDSRGREGLLAACLLETKLRLNRRTATKGEHIKCSSMETAQEPYLGRLAAYLTGAGY